MQGEHLTPFGPLPNRLAVDMTMDEQHDWLQRQVSRRTLLRAAGAMGASSLILWPRPDHAVAEANQLYGRHLAFGADPKSQMFIGFASKTSVRTASVRLDDGREADAEIRTVPGSLRYYLRASFDGLRPGTDYTYVLLIDGAQTRGGKFRTAPTGRAAFRFTAFGDQDVDAGAAAVLGRIAQAKPLLHLLAGDMCYADSSGQGGPGDVFHARQWDHWLRQNEPVTSGMPWMVVPGNHEMEPGFGVHGYAGWLSRVAVGGKSPLDIPVASSFQIGSVGFVGLDSNDVSNEIPANRGWTRQRQTAWLEQELAAYRNSPDIDFVVAFMHASPYCTSTAHGSEGGIREHWVPLFDKYAVDLVISGHNHCYQRALPLRHGVVTSSNEHEVDSAAGTTYVTVGGGGAGLNKTFGPHPHVARVATPTAHEPISAPWSYAPMALDYCFLVVDVQPRAVGTPARMHLRAVTQDGAVIDDWQIVRGSPGPAIGGGSWLWPDGAAVLGGIGALGVAGATVAARRRTRGTAAPAAQGGGGLSPRSRP